MKIAFVCSGANATPFSEFVPLSDDLRSRGHETFFLSSEPYPASIEVRLKETGQVYFPAGKSPPDESAPASSKSRARQKKKSRTPGPLRNLLQQIHGLVWGLYYLLRARTLVKRVFSEQRPEAVLVYGDRGLGATAPALAYARRENVPVIDLQIASTPVRFLAKNRIEHPHYQLKNRLNRRVAAKYPGQVMHFDERPILFYPWYTMIWLRWFGWVPPDPWHIGESWADRHLLISRQHLEDLKRDGCRLDNAEVVGQLSHDKLFRSFEGREALRQKLADSYFPDEAVSGDRLAILGLPQFYEHNLMDLDTALSEVRLILDALEEIPDLWTLISLHPKMPYERYAFINESYRSLRVVKEERLSELLPVGGLFLTVFESAVSWALMCGVIPVYLDYYQYGFDLSKYKGCCMLTNKPKYRQDLEDVLRDRDDWLARVQEDRDRLPPFDGKSGDRIEQALIKARETKINTGATS